MKSVRARPGEWLWLQGRRTALGAVLTLACLVAACTLASPIPDESAIETRVAATLTAMALSTQAPVSATSTETLPSETPTATVFPLPETPTPTETTSPATPTLTVPTAEVSPTETPLSTPPTPTETLPPPTPTPTSVPTHTPAPTNTRWPASKPQPAITDWRGEYYANRALTGAPSWIQNDLAVDFDWGQGAPAPNLPADGFSVRWTRAQDFDGVTYRFNVYVDDGVRLWVDNQIVIDAWTDGSARTVSAEYPMTRGLHEIRVDYYDAMGEALVQLWWEKIEAYPDWKGEYWSNRDLNEAPLLARNDLEVDFDWNAGAPAPGLPADNFAARWTRTAGFDAGIYRFHVLVDDGVRLWVDDQLILNAWYDSTPHEITADWAVDQGVHTLRIEYYEHTGGAQISVWWDKVGEPSYPGWKGEYWSNRNLDGDPRLVRNDWDIDFAWDFGAPAPGLPADDFAVRWSRGYDFNPGVYLFRVEADDGIRFYLDGSLVIDEWHDSRGTAVYSANRTLDGTHGLVVEYYEGAGDAAVKFWWTRVRSGPPR